MLHHNRTMQLFQTYPFLIPLLALFCAESIKILVATVKQRRFVWNVFFETGGMPSGHSSFAAAAMTTVYLLEGPSSPLFVVVMTFSFLVFYDAMKLRRNVGYHAEALNTMLQEKKYKERMGHTLIEVLAGAGLGSSVAIFSLL